jgi:DHA1 family bicyclomycin/chloramphenicol resistance-like MFS transporter
MRPTASLWLFTAMNGFVAANAISGALADFPMRAGAVSALMGAIQYGSGVAGSAVAGTFADGTPWPMGWVIAIGGVGSLGCSFIASASWRGPLSHFDADEAKNR